MGADKYRVFFLEIIVRFMQHLVVGVRRTTLFLPLFFLFSGSLRDWVSPTASSSSSGMEEADKLAARGTLTVGPVFLPPFRQKGSETELVCVCGGGARISPGSALDRPGT